MSKTEVLEIIDIHLKEYQRKQDVMFEGQAQKLIADGYRIEELVLFVKRWSPVSAAIGIDGRVVISDRSTTYIGPRTPVFAETLWIRRQWRKVSPYKVPANRTLERRVRLA